MANNVTQVMSFKDGVWTGIPLEEFNKFMKLSDNKDINTQNLQNGFTLIYDSEANQWIAKPATELFSGVGATVSIEELQNTNTEERLNGHCLVWDSVTQLWIARHITLRESHNLDIESGANSGDMLLWNADTETWESVPNAANEIRYSLDEFKIGKWLTDEDLYRKSYSSRIRLSANVPYTYVLDLSNGFPEGAAKLTDISCFYINSMNERKYSRLGQIPTRVKSNSIEFDILSSTNTLCDLDLTLEYIKVYQPITTTTSTTTSTTTIGPNPTLVPPTTSTTTTSTTLPPYGLIAQDVELYTEVPDWVEDPESFVTADSIIMTGDIINKPAGTDTRWTLSFGPGQPTVTDLVKDDTIHSINVTDVISGTYAFLFELFYPGSNKVLKSNMVFLRVNGGEAVLPTTIPAPTTSTSTTTSTTTLAPVTLKTTDIIIEDLTPEEAASIDEALLKTIFTGDLLNLNIENNGNIVTIVFNSYPYSIVSQFPQEWKKFSVLYLNASSIVPNFLNAGGSDDVIVNNMHIYGLTTMKANTLSRLTIGDLHLNDCFSLEYNSINNVTIQNFISLEKLTSFVDGSFNNCIIKDYDFRNLTNLPAYAFSKNPILDETITYNFNNLLETVGDSAFKEGQRINLYSINSNITTIGNRSFYGVSFDNPELNFQKVIRIGVSAFENTNLTYFGGQEVTRIRSNAFKNCVDLTSFSLDKVKYIEESSFEGCTSLDSINFEECLSISNRAFYGCSSVNYISLPKVQTIGDNLQNNQVFTGVDFTNLLIYKDDINVAVREDRDFPSWYFEDSTTTTTTSTTTTSTTTTSTTLSPNNLRFTAELDSTTEGYAGDLLTLFANVTGGTGNYTYTWYYNDDIIENQNQRFLEIDSLQLEDSGVYKLIVSDGINEVLTSTTLTVSVSPYLRSNTTLTNINSVVIEGTSVSYTLSPTGGNGNYTWSWSINGVTQTAYNNQDLVIDNVTQDLNNKVVRLTLSSGTETVYDSVNLYVRGLDETHVMISNVEITKEDITVMLGYTPEAFYSVQRNNARLFDFYPDSFNIEPPIPSDGDRYLTFFLKDFGLHFADDLPDNKIESLLEYHTPDYELLTYEDFYNSGAHIEIVDGALNYEGSPFSNSYNLEVFIAPYATTIGSIDLSYVKYLYAPEWVNFGPLNAPSTYIPMDLENLVDSNIKDDVLGYYEASMNINQLSINIYDAPSNQAGWNALANSDLISELDNLFINNNLTYYRNFFVYGNSHPVTNDDIYTTTISYYTTDNIPQNLTLSLSNIAPYTIYSIETSINIADNAFINNTDLARVEFRSNDAIGKIIGDNAFKGCTSLSNVTTFIEDQQVEGLSVGISAFEGCTNLSSASLKVEKIGNNCFKNCVKLNNCNISNVSEIGDDMLNNGVFEGATLVQNGTAFISLNNQFTNTNWDLDIPDSYRPGN